MTLRELGQRAGGLDYNAVGGAVSRFGRRLVTDRKLARLVSRLKAQLSNVEI
jgi:hypothetical protein